MFGRTIRVAKHIRKMIESVPHGPRAAFPRVLFIGTHLRVGAGNRSVGEDLAARLGKSGFQITLTSRIRSRPFRLFDMLATVWRLRRGYELAQVDLYSGAAFYGAEWVTRVLRFVRKPYILSLHGGNLPELAKDQRKRVERLIRSAAAVTAPSPFLANVVRPFRPDVRIIPNPLDLASYEYKHRSTLRPKLIWVRAFHRIYNPLLAAHVLAEVTRCYGDAELIMVGPDKDGTLDAFRAEATKLGLLKRVSFSGGISKSDVPAWLAKADVFLNTTTIDNTPVSVIEAMATGLPVVTTNVGGMPYLIEHEQTGMLVPSNDPKAMGNAVIRLLAEPSLASKVSQNARAKAETFGWDNVRPEWENLLLEVARCQRPDNV